MHLEHIFAPPDDIHSVYSHLDAFGLCWRPPFSGLSFARSDAEHSDFSLTILLKSQSEYVESQSIHHRSRGEVEEDVVDEAATTVVHVEPKTMVEAIAAKLAPHLRFTLHQTPESRQSVSRQSATP